MLRRKISGAPHEVFLVLDATNGQNAIRQAEVFTKSIGCTGVILTKLDGTAKEAWSWPSARRSTSR